MSVGRCPGSDTSLWKPGDIYDVLCPACGTKAEFFKDEPKRKCSKCGFVVTNPKVNMGCAQWCEHAAECLGADAPAVLAKAEASSGSASSGGSGIPEPRGHRLKIKLITKMKEVFGDDFKRVKHALKVLQYAEQILGAEKADSIVVISAAVLHDIGIQEAEKKHGSCAGNFQEIEGPPIARRILEELEVEPDKIEHICKIIANHHSAKDIDTPEFRIIWDADLIVNAQDDNLVAAFDDLKPFVEKHFKTEAGAQCALEHISPAGAASA